MMTIYNFLVDNIYLYICIILILIIIATILSIISSNQKARRKIKSDLVEAEKVDNELQKVEETKNNELEDIIKKMQEDIDIKPEEVVKKFEDEQEEKAIISYKELVDNVNAGKVDVVDDELSDVNFVETLIDTPIDGINEVIIDNNNEINEQKEDAVTPEMVKDAIMNISASSVKEEPKKFKQSAFISPIYGVMDEKLEYPTVKKIENTNTLDLLNTKDYNELSLAIERQEEFLQALKEFRNNL